MKAFLRHIKSVYFSRNTFIIFGVLVGFMVISMIHPILYYLGVLAVAAFLVLIVVDYVLLFWRGGDIAARRRMADVLSIGSDNTIYIDVTSLYSLKVDVSLVDDIPYQFNWRDFKKNFVLTPAEEKVITYTVRPTVRGNHEFGDLNFFIRTDLLGLIERKLTVPQSHTAKVYPSLIHMEEIELKSISKIALNQGVKKMRRLGHSYEFEQIKTYVQGDDYRSINWNATARHQSLMINQYEDEKSQPIYFAVDKGRNMLMPFNGLSLMDYAVNTTLAISNIALKKSDRCGLITFDKDFNGFVKAEHRRGQLSNILETLYQTEQTDVESNFNALYQVIKQQVRQRSLIFLFTNCNTLHTLERIKPVLHLISKQHLLVTVMFENSEISDFAGQRSITLEDVYEHTIAEKFIYEQRRIAAELNAVGIQTIVSKPEELSIQTINKYLELKAKGKI